MPTPHKQHSHLRLFAAGSLKAVLAEIIQAFHQAEGIRVYLETGPSGILRQNIETGEKSALIVKRHLDGLRIQELPDALRVETVCALAKLASAAPASDRFIDLLLSETGRSIFKQHGFKPA